tara:strand:+ start:81 stop:806 length:726 start_codon:yes stop_codon:yes gene_type:complete
MHLTLPKNSNISISPIESFSDNYIWLIERGNDAILIDPGDHKPAVKVLQEKKLNLKAILVTHKHFDHIGGISSLIDSYPSVEIYAPLNNYNFNFKQVKDGDLINLSNIDLSFTVIKTPGHTLDHVVYIDQDHLFCGDTLFACGCGRIFEGTYKQMYESLTKISSLPENIKVYCAHEYTMDNIEFALIEDKANKALLQRKEKLKNLKVTLPTTIKEELETNPFLRARNESVFKKLRIKKDAY